MSSSGPSPGNGGAAATGAGTKGGISGGSGSTSGGAASAPDKAVAFSFTSNLLAGADTADGFAALFRALYMALDEHRISYLQGTLNVVVDAAVADEFAPLIAELGLTATIRDI